MPYILKKFDITSSVKIEDFLLETVELDSKTANSLLSKGKILDQKNRRLQKNQTIKNGYIQVNVYEAITKGLEPLFDSFHFAIFDKPSGLKVHPSNIDDEYTLLDEIQFQFGKEASLVHRIDAETSGLVLVSKNPYSQMVLKNMFEEKKYKKTYLAYVENEIKEEIEIDSPIASSNGLIKLKMQISEEGKNSLTNIKPISFDKETNLTLVQALPITGRQHQIRVHLDSIGHRIIGDPIYGIDEKLCDMFLKKKMSEEQRIEVSGKDRLMLHAYSLEFTFLNTKYSIVSKQEFK
ncbi:RluA family pseudouridine synthase [Poseidonibacter lekithochrous]|uniref:RluA family pseudouridine synthase n=1 Tax=Poseidonibacter lekithochrous TaxID=1904463 RepID=UPI000D332EBB|nr:RNA pseudouridine synthase [Poseidonibacter lekithochrous]